MSCPSVAEFVRIRICTPRSISRNSHEFRYKPVTGFALGGGGDARIVECRFKAVISKRLAVRPLFLQARDARANTQCKLRLASPGVKSTRHSSHRRVQTQSGCAGRAVSASAGRLKIELCFLWRQVSLNSPNPDRLADRSGNLGAQYARSEYDAARNKPTDVQDGKRAGSWCSYDCECLAAVRERRQPRHGRGLARIVRSNGQFQ